MCCLNWRSSSFTTLHHKRIIGSLWWTVTPFRRFFYPRACWSFEFTHSFELVFKILVEIPDIDSRTANTVPLDSMLFQRIFVTCGSVTHPASLSASEYYGGRCVVIRSAWVQVQVVWRALPGHFPVTRLVDPVPHVLHVGTETLFRLCMFTYSRNTIGDTTSRGSQARPLR